MRRLFVLAVLLISAMVAGTVTAAAHETADLEGAALVEPSTEGEGVAMEPVANLQYEPLAEGRGQNGSDIEFLKVGDKEYALAGTLRNGLQIVDITDPTAASIAAVYQCPINQGDVQVFRQGERILATYTADSRINSDEGFAESQCVTEANALGAEIDGPETGTFLVDLSDPTAPTTVSFIEIAKGSHNQTVHPSGDYLYNSNSDLIINSPLPQITIHDISKPSEPRHVQDFRYPPGQPALGEESHDLSFNAAGTRAYVASLGSTLILDTSNPEDPSIVSQFSDPSNDLVHGAHAVSLPREDGTVREILITTDEQAGALPQSNCPGGGLHVYDITGDKERNPLANKQGVWFIPAMGPALGETCTAHVLRIYRYQQMMTIAWYSQGVRTLDISGLAEFQGSARAVAFGDGVGIKEVGNYVFDDADTWSFKTNRISADGSFFGYGNDIARGLDIYRFDGAASELGRTVPVLEPEDMAAPGCTGVPIASAYVDRATARDAHERSIDCVISRAIARGSVKDAMWFYEPLTDVTRAQMASFIASTLRAGGIDAEFPEAPAEDKFTDIADSVHRANINLLAEAGIINGVGDDKYNPDGLITRAQMATFIVKAAQFAVEPDLTESGGPRFSDVEGNTHETNIEIGSDNALFSGTRTGIFSPGRNVPRDQMASFLVNLLTALGGPNGPGRPVLGG